MLESLDVRRLTDLVDQCTSEKQPDVDQQALRALKFLCRGSDEHIKYTFELLQARLKSQHAQTRLYALVVCDQLFTRSRTFRGLLADQLPLFLDLTIGHRSERPLPPPPSVAERLREKALAVIEGWDDSYGVHYPQVQLGVRYLKDVLKMRFPEVRARAAAAAAEVKAREELVNEKYEALCGTFRALAADAAATLGQIEACYALLDGTPMESSAVAQRGAGAGPRLPAPPNGGNMGNAGDEEEWEVVPAAGLGAAEASDVEEAEGLAAYAGEATPEALLFEAAAGRRGGGGEPADPALTEQLRGLHRELAQRHLPALQDVLRVCVRAEVGEPGQPKHARRERMLRSAVALRERAAAAQAWHAAMWPALVAASLLSEAGGQPAGDEPAASPAATRACQEDTQRSCAGRVAEELPAGLPQLLAERSVSMDDWEADLGQPLAAAAPSVGPSGAGVPQRPAGPHAAPSAGMGPGRAARGGGLDMTVLFGSDDEEEGGPCGSAPDHGCSSAGHAHVKQDNTSSPAGRFQALQATGSASEAAGGAGSSVRPGSDSGLAQPPAAARDPAAAKPSASAARAARAAQARPFAALGDSLQASTRGHAEAAAFRTKSRLPDNLKAKLLEQAPMLEGGAHLTLWDSEAAAALVNARHMELYNHWGAVDETVQLPPERLAQLFATRASYYTPIQTSAAPKVATVPAPVRPPPDFGRAAPTPPPRRPSTTAIGPSPAAVLSASLAGHRAPVRLTSQHFAGAQMAVQPAGPNAGREEPAQLSTVACPQQHNVSDLARSLNSSALRSAPSAACRHAAELDAQKRLAEAEPGPSGSQGLPQLKRPARHASVAAAPGHNVGHAGQMAGKEPAAISVPETEPGRQQEAGQGTASARQRRQRQAMADRAHNAAVLSSAGDASLAEALAEQEQRAARAEAAKRGGLQLKRKGSVRERLLKKLKHRG